jgi:predicted ATPase
MMSDELLKFIGNSRQNSLCAQCPESFSTADAVYYAIRMVYESLGDYLIEVPKLPVEARCEFVLGNVCE